jgi:hypothetical protein
MLVELIRTLAKTTMFTGRTLVYRKVWVKRRAVWSQWECLWVWKVERID